MVNSQRSRVKGQRSRVKGQRSRVNGQWSMVNGQRSRSKIKWVAVRRGERVWRFFEINFCRSRSAVCRFHTLYNIYRSVLILWNKKRSKEGGCVSWLSEWFCESRQPHSPLCFLRWQKCFSICLKYNQSGSGTLLNPISLKMDLVDCYCRNHCLGDCGFQERL